jgi:hypothetical protein
MVGYVRSGSEFLVNTATASGQYNSSVAVLSDGRFIVTWDTSDSTQDGSGWAVKAQLFDANGVKIGSEFLVNTESAGLQKRPSVSELSDGGFVIAWESANAQPVGSTWGIKARIFGASGSPVGSEFLVSSTVGLTDFNGPSVTTLSNGNFVISWDNSLPDNVLARIFSPSGTAIGSTFGINTNLTAKQDTNDIIGLAGGGFVSVWRTTDSTQDSNSDAVKAQLFDQAGTKIGGEFLINTNVAGSQTEPAIAALANGGFVATWAAAGTSQASDDGDLTAIKAQIFDASGNKVGGEFLVNTMALHVQKQPVVTALPDGRFMIAWVTFDTTQDGNMTSVKGQIFEASGVRVGPEFLINTQALGEQKDLDIATLNDGRIVVTWGDGGAGNAVWDIRGQIFAPDNQAPAENVAPFITSNGGGETANISLNENTLIITSVTATDANGTPSVFSIIGGADAALFTIGSQTGLLRFVQSSNFENPTDSDGNNIYELIVSSSDGTLTDTQTIVISIANVNESPVITSNGAGGLASISVSENTTAVTTVTSTDPENNAVTYIIAGGADAARFTINSVTGALSFVAAPNFEAANDSGLNNVYDVIVSASDGGVFTDTQALAITVTNVNEAPVITSNGGGDTANVSISENSTAFVSVTSTDPENTARTYSIAGGADAALFTINAATGALRFISGRNFEAPSDVGGNNVYDVIVRASDGTLSDTQAIAFTVTNVNEAVTITSGTSFVATENSTLVATMSATDLDGTSPTFAITGGADAALFTINATTGVLSFVNAPNFEAPGDSSADNVYNLTIQATDGQLSVTRAIAVTVGNQNEPVVITSNGGGDTAAISVSENISTVTMVSASDAENVALTYTITGGADAALFAIDAATGVLSFVTTPDHEAPSDANGDNVYEVIVEASDGSLVDTQAISVTVGDVNEAPVITSNGGGASAALTVGENGTAVTTITAGDVDGQAINYAIAGGADAALFAIDAATGELSFVAAPNHEALVDADGNNVYDVVVQASDGVLSDSQTILVTVGDVNEAPEISSNGGGVSAVIGVSENGFAVTTVTASDVDGPSISFAVASGADAAFFAIDPVTGVLSFVGAPDFEAPTDAGGDNVYEVIVEASDGSLVDTQAISVTVGDVNEAPVITSNGGGASAALTVGENGTAVTTVAAGDVDGQAINYAIAGGADAALFAIDAVTGLVSFIAEPDFEAPLDAGTDNIYDVLVSASDGFLLDFQSLAISVGNANEAPVITSNGGGSVAALSVAENGVGVTTVSATDPDGNPRSYLIVGGADAARFTINATTGALAFVNTPNFEAPTDTGANNVYDVIVQASDGTLFDTQALAVTVSNVNEAPVITSNGGGATASLAVNENTIAVTTITSTDPEGAARSYSIVGGTDAARFSVNATTGVLSFVSAPNFEAPADAGANNVYNLVVRVSDGVNTTTQALAVAVNNIVDGSTINGSNTANTLIGTVAEDIINGLGGNDTITGGLGADTLTGGTGADRFTYTSLFESRVGNMDVITDFVRLQKDKISLSAIDANTNVAGDQAFAFIGTAAFSNVAGQLGYQVVNGNTIISGDVNGDSLADFAIQVNGTFTPIAADFIL